MFLNEPEARILSEKLKEETSFKEALGEDSSKAK